MSCSLPEAAPELSGPVRQQRAAKFGRESLESVARICNEKTVCYFECTGIFLINPKGEPYDQSKKTVRRGQSMHAGVFLVTELTSILAISLGYLVSRVSPCNAAGSAGAAGSWLMFTGMVIGALQFKNRPAGQKLSLIDLREALKK